LIESLCRKDPIFGGICLSRNFGHQGAVLAGLQSAPGDAVVSIDADLQDDIGAIGKMVESLYQGYEVVYGVRRERTVDTAFKRLTALGFYRLMSVLGAKTVHNHADFRLLSRRALQALGAYREVNLYLRGIVPLIGFPSATVLYDRSARTAGETKYPLRKMLALSLSAITSFSNVPLRLITLVALISILLLLATSGWVIWAQLFTHRVVPGWTSILLPTLFIGSINLLAIGVLGEYMARIFEEVKARPRYIVSSAINLHE
jgi:glycosyltransferase involved in cell wall biosynthesis